MKTTKELLESVGINGVSQVSYNPEMTEARNNALVMAKNLAKVMPLVKRDEPSTLDTINLHSHKSGVDTGKYGTFNVDKITPEQIHVIDHKDDGKIIKVNRQSGRGIGEHSHLMLKESEINEISQSTKDRYIAKAVSSHTDANAHRREAISTGDKSTEIKMRRRMDKRNKGMTRAFGESTEQIDEISADTMKSYISKSYVQSNKMHKADQSYVPKSVKDSITAGLKKRKFGIQTVAKRLGKDVVEPIWKNAQNESLNESLKFIKHPYYDPDYHSIEHHGLTVGTISKGGPIRDHGYSVKFGGHSLKHEVAYEKSLKAAKEAAKYHLQQERS